MIGSRSGVHAGVLRGYSTGTGESFLPARPFLPGERVTVHASVHLASASRQASTTFTIAYQAALSQKEFPINPGNARAVQHYSSAPKLTPSTLSITTPARARRDARVTFSSPPIRERARPGR